MEDVPRTRVRTRARRTYHHGDLRTALVREAARTIRTAGVEALTLRDVGRRLGVSRTALYRHFADKSALLAAVAREGFQAFSRELREAWDTAGGGLEGFRAMGMGYVRFARTNPAHYRIMFGQYRALCESDAALASDASASFGVLLDALATLERDGAIPASDRSALGHFIWASMHGVAMLSIDGQLGADPAAADALTAVTVDRISAAIAGTR
jgi:AcrR family transcriptional regulator